MIGRGDALLSDVSGLIDHATRVLEDPDAVLAGLKELLKQPLTLAVAGRTSTGKSTLVNALIGHRVAPTARNECTKVVTRYRFGPQQAELVARDGSRQPLWLEVDPLTGQRHLPPELPLPVEQVDHLDVPLDFEELRNLIIIDTPGLSGEEDLAEGTHTLLDSDGVDVLLFIFGRDTLRDDERTAVAAFRRKTRPRYAFPGNAFGVLSRADTYPGDDPMAAARTIAAAHAFDLRRQLAGVLPVMCRIAETAESAALSQNDIDALNIVAAVPEPQRTTMLRTASRFENSEALSEVDLPRSLRTALRDRLDVHGIRALTGRDRPGSSMGVMYEAMRQMSGVRDLRTRIDSLFVRQQLVHKVARVLAEIETLTTRPAIDKSVHAEILDKIEVIRGGDAMHTITELEALAILYSGACTLDDGAAREAALRLFESADPAVRLSCETDNPASVEQAAAAAINYWQAYANTAMDGMSRKIARTAVRSASIIRQDLKAP